MYKATKETASKGKAKANANADMQGTDKDKAVNQQEKGGGIAP